MSPRRSLAPLLAAAFLAVGVAPVSAQDASPAVTCAAPSGPVDAPAIPGGSESLTGAQPGPAPASAPIRCWTGTDGNSVLGGRIVLIGEQVYGLTDQGEAIAFDPDGSEAWRIPLTDPAQGTLGGLATDGTSLFVGTPTGLVALSPADGSTVWTYPVDPGMGMGGSTGVFSPVVTGSGVAALVYTSADGGTYERSLVVVIASSGEEAWTQPVAADLPAGPLTADGTSIAVAEGDGSLVLRDAATGAEQLRLTGEQLGAAVGTPIVLTADALIFGTRNSDVTARSRSDGSQAWSVTPASGIVAALSADGGSVFVNGSTSLYALDAGTGASVWEAEMQASAPPFAFQPLPALADGLVILGTSDINNPGALMAFDAATGAQAWRVDLDLYGVLFSPVVAGGRIYTPSFDLIGSGGVIAFGLPG